ncbi:hypothetical protein CCP3SC15_420022 [Gammaproteobacteria bacterium]
MVEFTIHPDMCGKVIDASHYKFHVTCKAKMINAVNKLRKGTDFLKALSGLNFSANKEWMKNSCNDPLVAAMIRILDRYKVVETRPSRKKIVVPLLEYGIGLMNDLFWRERITWFIWQIRKETNDTMFPEIFLDPNNWFPAGRGTTTEQKEYEARGIPIEDEYRDWYGVDVVGDIDGIPQEQEAQIISDGVMWVKQNDQRYREIPLK